ncbi:MAG: NTP transferase domain-containing protein [Porphyrobacter sp.]|nr:NTP transferase domain-containing protein [Porphyrobacter sp.]
MTNDPPPPVTGAPCAPVTVIVLAGQRAGVTNPLAVRAGVSHKCLAPIRGKPLLAHVLDTLTTLPSVAEIRVSLEPEAHGEVQALLAPYLARGVPIRLVASDTNIVESVLAAAGTDPGPFIITTADNVLLTRAGVEALRLAMEEADAVIALTRKECVHAAHPEGQRNFYELRDGGYANCNLYGITNRKAFAAAEAFREGGQFQKNPRRLARAVGLVNIVLMRFRLIGMEAAMRRLSRRFGVTIRAVSFADGALAIDVDNERTYRICEELLAARSA